MVDFRSLDLSSLHDKIIATLGDDIKYVTRNNVEGILFKGKETVEEDHKTIESFGFVLEQIQKPVPFPRYGDVAALFQHKEHRLFLHVIHTSGIRGSVFYSDEEHAELIEKLCAALPKAHVPPKPDLVRVNFASHNGGARRTIALPRFKDIVQNYDEPTEKAIKSMIDNGNPEELGKLIIWHGVPGTGKTYAVRALAREWADRYNAGVTVITDMDVFLADSSYMLETILEDPPSSSLSYNFEDREEQAAELYGTDNRIHLFLLEDQGQLFTSNCRERQGFEKFLNLTDGLIGQGLRSIFLITFNEDIKDMDKALTRAGRCIQLHEFKSFDLQKSLDWLDHHNIELPSEAIQEIVSVGGFTLSELYSLKAAEDPMEWFAEQEKVYNATVGF